MVGVGTERTSSSTMTRKSGHSELDQSNTRNSHLVELKPTTQVYLHKR